MKQRRIYKIYPRKTIARIDKKIKLLGSNYPYTTSYFLHFRFIFSFVVFFLLFFFLPYGYLFAPLFLVGFYLFCEKIFLDYPIKKRAKKLEHEAIFFFEILSLTLDSGRTLSSALQLTVQNIDNELSTEFKKTLKEVQLGKSFSESLNAMKERIPSETIENLILSLIESSIYGSNIIESINTELDYLRDKQLLDIKAEIAKLPTKISIISVLFFIPILLLVILSPVMIEFFTR